MKFASVLSALTFGSVAYGHCIFQKVSVNGVDQGQLKGVRAPSSNNPIQNVNDAGMSCNNAIQYKDSNIINIPAGARVGAWWGHVIGGPQVANDPDNPIAPSHKGPVSVYLAKVDNAASTGTSGLKWFKIAEDGLTNNNGQWGVDRMIQNQGWQYFNFPTCVAPGQYLMRAELLALHSAYSQGGAQFYVGCAQINVQSSGTSTGTDLVSFPGAYQPNDSSIVISIYNGTVPNNNGRPYKVPGPAPLQCPAGQPSYTSTSTTSTYTTTTTTQQQPQPTAPANGAVLYGQCGGSGWTGPTTCQQGKCTAVNDWYSQCTP
ncbi:endoglucanase II [Ephemerocybe angulata]|uniref:AA9 family lytic polysaccharide monooxygenase n=1 Tax=Ephemerocybe angulata TaxID=980116 RepID=A0A8H6HYP5_9AGAR|nr:endoglucanase II [Tulosesus angulatus]